MKNETVKGEFIKEPVAPQPARLRHANRKHQITVAVSAVVLGLYVAGAIMNRKNEEAKTEKTEED